MCPITYYALIFYVLLLIYIYFLELGVSESDTAARLGAATGINEDVLELENANLAEHSRT